MRARAAIAGIALVCAGAASQAAERLNDYDVPERLGDEKPAWEEFKAELPAYPKPDNLIELREGPNAAHHYYIDATSVRLGKDGVMRYSAVIKTSGGATNVTFEGIRCQTRERKIYAVGHKDGTWVEARDSSWRSIDRYQPPAYTLWRDYFCPARTLPTKPQQAIDAIKRGTPLAGGPTGY